MNRIPDIDYEVEDLDIPDWAEETKKIQGEWDD